MKSASHAVWIGVLAIGVATSALSQQADPTQPSKVLVHGQVVEYTGLPAGQRAPDFTTYTANGEKVSLSDLKGKVVIVDFWASWCGPCKISMPGLEEIYRQVKSEGVVVLSVNTWDQMADFKSWVQKNSGTKYDFEFVRDPAEGDHDAIRKASIAKRLYKVVGIPTMYVIGRDGNVAGSVIGARNEKKLLQILSKVGISAAMPPQR